MTLFGAMWDEVLKQVAGRLFRSARVYDWVGRYGGEEFLSIVSACSTENLRKHAERIRAGIAEEPISTSAGEVKVTVSIGATVALFDRIATSRHYCSTRIRPSIAPRNVAATAVNWSDVELI